MLCRDIADAAFHFRSGIRGGGGDLEAAKRPAGSIPRPLRAKPADTRLSMTRMGMRTATARPGARSVSRPIATRGRSWIAVRVKEGRRR